MAPIQRVIKVDSYDYVIEDFERLYTQARFSSKSYSGNYRYPTFYVAGMQCSILIHITVCSAGMLVVTIGRGCLQGHRFCFRGRINFVETNNSVALKAVKLCGSPHSSMSGCWCGSQCKFGGVSKQINLSLPIGDDVPVKATIRVELEFLPFDDEPTEVLQDDGNSDFKRDIAAMRKKSESADIQLICNGRHFWAHKFILSARSDVFAALFSHKGTKEDESGEVHIKDCDHEAMEMFLAYLYENTPPPLDTTFEVAKQLMNVANKYNVPSLKKKCSKILLACLNEDNAFEMAMWGNLYNMDSMKKAAKATIAASDKNLIDMIDNSGFRLQDKDNE